MQKLLFLALCGVIALFQYELWMGHGGIYDSHRLANTIDQKTQQIQQLQDRNDTVVDHLLELKGSPELMEARARRDMSLVKPDETLIILPNSSESTNK